jgi:hypothetical protein
VPGASNLGALFRLKGPPACCRSWCCGRLALRTLVPLAPGEDAVIGRRELAGGAIAAGAAGWAGPRSGAERRVRLRRPLDHRREPATCARPTTCPAALGGAGARGGPRRGGPCCWRRRSSISSLWGLQPFVTSAESPLAPGVALLFFAALAALTGEFPAGADRRRRSSRSTAGGGAGGGHQLPRGSALGLLRLAALAAIGAARRSGRGGAGRAPPRSCSWPRRISPRRNAAVAPILLVLLDVSAPTESGGRAGWISWSWPAPLMPILWRAWAMGGAALVSHTAELPPEHRTPLTAVPIAAWSFLCGVGQLLVPWRSRRTTSSSSVPALGWAALRLIALGAALAWRARRASAGWRWACSARSPPTCRPSASCPSATCAPIAIFYLPSLPLSLAAGALLAGWPRAPALRGAASSSARPGWCWRVLVALLGRARGSRRASGTTISRCGPTPPACSRRVPGPGPRWRRRGCGGGCSPALTPRRPEPRARRRSPRPRAASASCRWKEGDLTAAHRALERALAAPSRTTGPSGSTTSGVRAAPGSARRGAGPLRRGPAPGAGYEQAWLNAARTLQQKGDVEGARRLLQGRPQIDGP